MDSGVFTAPLAGRYRLHFDADGLHSQLVAVKADPNPFPRINLWARGTTT